MGWGATSNRAGYKNLITAQHNYDSTNFPPQTPQVQFLKFKMSGGTPESDQVMDVVQASMKSSDGQSNTVIGGILVPSITSVGVLQNWSDSNGGHYGWKPVNEVPASTAQDEGKVLTVDSNGAAAWSDTKTFIAVYHTTSFADILAAYNSGRQVLLDIGGYVLLSVFSIDSSNVRFTTLSPGTPNSPPVFFNTSVDDQNVWTAIKTYKGPALTVHTLSDSPSILINGLNNGFGTITLNQATFTLQVEVADGETINFALEVTNQQQCQVTIQKKVGNTVTTLKHSVAAGNTMEANTTYQITAVGNCWTLAEFEA